MLPLVMENFLLYLRGENKNEKTIYTYRKNLKCFYEGVFNGIEPSNDDYNNITIEDLMKWIEKLRKDNGLSASSLNQRVATLKKFYNYLVGVKLVNENITKNIGSIKSDELFQRTVLTVDEVKILTSQAKDNTNKFFKKDYDRYCAYRDEMIVNLFLFAGLRIEELSKITLNDINLKDKQITITGKRNKKRIVAIPNSKMNMLLNYLNERRCLISSYLDDSLFLSKKCSKDSKYGLSTCQIRRIVVNLAKEANIKTITPHSLRHTGATLQIQQGMDLIDVSKWLGHSTVTITEKIYVHQTNVSAHKVADLFDSMF